MLILSPHPHGLVLANKSSSRLALCHALSNPQHISSHMDPRIRCWLPDSEGLGRDLPGAFEREGERECWGNSIGACIPHGERGGKRSTMGGALRVSPAFHQRCWAEPHVAWEVLRTWHRICVLEGTLLGTAQV